MIVTSWELYVGFSGIGIGRNVQCEMQFTIKRKYRNNLGTWLPRCVCKIKFEATAVGDAVLLRRYSPCKDGDTKPGIHAAALNERRGWERQSLHRTSAYGVETATIRGKETRYKS
jgi:hypothetical protein